MWSADGIYPVASKSVMVFFKSTLYTSTSSISKLLCIHRLEIYTYWGLHNAATGLITIKTGGSGKNGRFQN